MPWEIEAKVLIALCIYIKFRWCTRVQSSERSFSSSDALKACWISKERQEWKQNNNKMKFIIFLDKNAFVNFLFYKLILVLIIISRCLLHNLQHFKARYINNDLDKYNIWVSIFHILCKNPNIWPLPIYNATINAIH